MQRRRFLLAAGALCAGAAMHAHAQDYPSRPIRLVVPFAAGGPTDNLARAYAARLADVLGQPVVVENRTGAGGNIGTEAVVRSPRDGYTLVFGTNGPIAANVSLFRSLPYDPVRDLAPITQFAFVPNMLAVHPSVPVNNVGELIALLKASPDKYSFASGGHGTTQHFGGELLKLMTGTKMSHVPYRGEGPAITDVIGGQVPIVFSSLAVGTPYVRSGRLRALAVTSARRSPALPEVPTMIEAGIAGYDMSAWFGVLAPAGTPRDVILKLNAASVQVIRSDEMAQKLVAIGGMPAPSTPEEFGAFIRSEIPRWARLVEQTGAKVD